MRKTKLSGVAYAYLPGKKWRKKTRGTEKEEAIHQRDKREEETNAKMIQEGAKSRNIALVVVTGLDQGK